jgi:hypothetical protein
VSEVVDGGLVEVRIIGLPVQIADEASEHFAELSREFLHLANADEDVRRDVPGQLLELSDALRERFSSLTEANEERLAAASARGDETIDLVYHLPREAGPAAKQLGDLLDEADRYCESGEYLLTLRTPPAALEYRRWYLAQFVDQLDGGEAVSFADWRAARPDA